MPHRAANLILREKFIDDIGGKMQLDVWVMNGLTTIQSVCPAVRSIRSMACEPLASVVFS
jgi:hypothetical protein